MGKFGVREPFWVKKTEKGAFWLKMGFLGQKDSKRSILAQNGPFWVKKTQKGSFWLKMGHFGSKRAILVPFWGPGEDPQSGPFWLKMGHFGSKWAILAQKGQKGLKRGPLKALGYTQAKSTRGAPPPTQTASMGLIMTALLVLKLLKMKFWQSNRIGGCRSDRIFPDIHPLGTGLAK